MNVISKLPQPKKELGLWLRSRRSRQIDTTFEFSSLRCKELAWLDRETKPRLCSSTRFGKLGLGSVRDSATEGAAMP